MRLTASSSHVLAALLLASPLAAQDAPPDLDHYVARVMKTFTVPGLSVAIVKDGRLVMAKGYGVRRLGDPAPVDEHTRFGIASNTKLFTATALELLVEEGKVEWDAPVVRYLPWFAMSDPYVTHELTVRDLLVHRSGLGLGAGDLLWWPPSTYNRDEIARRLRYIPLVHLVPERVRLRQRPLPCSGQGDRGGLGTELGGLRPKPDSPEGRDDGQRRAPLGAKKAGNVAATHAEVEGTVRPVAPFLSDNTNPAGGIMSGAADMAKWMMVQLDSGRVSAGGRLFEPRAVIQLWRDVTAVPINPAPEGAPHLRPTMAGYALGLNVRDYRGRRLLQHTGGLPGYVSKVAMIPELRLGVVVLTNQESGAAFESIVYHVLDHYLGAKAPDYPAVFERMVKKNLDEVRAMEGKAAAARDSTSGPSLPLERYAGTYRDPWYGDVKVAREGPGLVIRFTRSPSLVGDLIHWQHDSFFARWRDRELRADAYATFWLNHDGSIARLRLVPSSPLVDFSFDFQDLDLRPVSPDSLATR